MTETGGIAASDGRDKIFVTKICSGQTVIVNNNLLKVLFDKLFDQSFLLGLVVYFEISNLSILCIAKYQLNSGDIFSWFEPSDEIRIVIFEASWSIGAHLVLFVLVENKANIEISFIAIRPSLHSFANS